MAIELEAKFAVGDHEPVRRLLQEHGATFLGRAEESNTIHDRPDGQLRRGGCGLRVRTNEVLEGEAPPPTLTFKGPVQTSEFKKREELVLPLTEADGMRRLLEAIGFVEVLSFDKVRESWRLDDCLVELDDVPELGHFVEIEGPDEETVQRVRQILGLASAEHITQGYVSLIAQLRGHND